MDATSLRLLVKIAAEKGWHMGKLDVSTAFLNAPLDQDIVIVQPPRFLVELGLVAEGEYWLLRRALYGLRVAPRKWELERDKRMRDATWTEAGRTWSFKQLSSDASVWLVLADGVAVGVFGVTSMTSLPLVPEAWSRQLCDRSGHCGGHLCQSCWHSEAAGSPSTFQRRTRTLGCRRRHA